jgi:hypothetical protein
MTISAVRTETAELNKKLLQNFIKSDKQSRTQLEHATSWSRAFTKLLNDLKWINAYARLNTIAC